jgi:hypothetical protein
MAPLALLRRPSSVERMTTTPAETFGALAGIARRPEDRTT